MSLLANTKIKQDLNERINEFMQFGMILNYMLEIDQIKETELEKIFFDNDQDKAMLIYKNILQRIDPSYINSSYDFYSSKYPNNDNITNNKYHELLNKMCITNLVEKVSNDSKSIDKTYTNTYLYILEKEKMKK